MYFSNRYPTIMTKFVFTAPRATTEELKADQVILQAISTTMEGRMKGIIQSKSTCRDTSMSNMYAAYKRIPANILKSKFNIDAQLFIHQENPVPDCALELLTETLDNYKWSAHKDASNYNRLVISTLSGVLPDLILYTPMLHYLLLAANILGDQPVSTTKNNEKLRHVNKIILENSSMFQRESGVEDSIAIFTAFFGYLLQHQIFTRCYIYPTSYASAACAEEYALTYPSDFVAFCKEYNVDLGKTNFYHMMRSSGNCGTQTQNTKLNDVFGNKLSNKSTVTW